MNKDRDISKDLRNLQVKQTAGSRSNFTTKQAYGGAVKISTQQTEKATAPKDTINASNHFRISRNEEKEDKVESKSLAQTAMETIRAAQALKMKEEAEEEEKKRRTSTAAHGNNIQTSSRRGNS